jgi:hypothetical protein
MVFEEIVQRFVDQRPIAVMTRVILERQFSPEFFDDTFGEVAQEQYVRDLTFSSCAKLLAQVTLGTAPTVHAAFLKDRETIPVTVTAVYDKLQGIEPRVCEALLQRSAEELHKVILRLAKRRRPLPGYRLRILDGNVLAGTEHRLKELRGTGAAALPGMSLVLYDYDTNLITGLLACEDGHTNERSLVGELLPQVKAGDLIMADRNFCTLELLTGIEKRNGAFLVRHHKGSSLIWQGQRKACGRGRTGRVYEQHVRVSDGITCRAILVQRDKPLQDGSREVILLTNVPATKASARRLAELYLQRWTIEETFRQLTEYLSCEVSTLGYPKAALFAFTLAVLAYNALACVKAALAKGHPRTKGDDWSSFYLAWEVKAAFDGLLVAVPPEQWQPFAVMTADEFAQALQGIAESADPLRYAKRKRGPKKAIQREKVSRGSHVSTAKVLARRETKRRLMANAS